ncbi:hypothetical protein PRK78_007119 [Emydomyces testavorans]|uniref:Trafficking protein particle complex II-specific subunit 65 IgD3 domain-containing protein n=1 Tax=Emydomyces testavorans TaxID=2070801 RepID=A0AAF0DNS9_9EURO|nr:hypothetical protein PRK78_007119 [Emydomyces testavorans]
MTANLFLTNATINTIVPYESNIDLEDVLRSFLQKPESAGISTWPFSIIRQRDLLFFDELVTVYIILQLVDCTDVATLKLQLSSISVNLEVFAVNVVASKPNVEDIPTSTKELIFSSFMQDADDPLIIVNAVDNEECIHNQAYVIWKSDAYLRRPWTRLQQPSVVFMASAAVGPPTGLHKAIQDEYISSLTPASANVFQPLIYCPLQSSTEPYLPASRLLRVAPAAKTREQVDNVSQALHNTPTRIIHAASAKLRYSRLNTCANRASVIASLDLEVAPFANIEVKFESVELSLSEGTVEKFGPLVGSEVPIFCRARDDVTLMFKLIPNGSGRYSSSIMPLVSTLEISICAFVLFSKDCQPKILMHWKANVDFPLPPNSLFGNPSRVLQQNNRPSSLPEGSNELAVPKMGTSSSPNRRTSYFSWHRIAVSFSVPISVDIGELFDLGVFVVNRSDRIRRFAMMVITSGEGPHSRKIITQSSLSFASRNSAHAPAAVDENSIFTMRQDAATSYETKLLCLCPELEFGPLLPGTCCSLPIRMLPLCPGLLWGAVVKFIDLDTNEWMEFGDLPDIAATSKQGF